MINVPDAELWYQAPGTVTGIEGGELQRQSRGKILRSDAARLMRIGALAQAWYGRKRRELRMVQDGIAPLEIGTIIEQVSDRDLAQDVGTVVTRVAYDLEAGTTTITTSYQDIDLRSIA